MRLLFDTSVIVAATLRAHVHHARAGPRLERVLSGRDDGIISAHSVAETFAALSTYPIRPRPTPSEVRAALRANLFSHFAIKSLTVRDYEIVTSRLLSAGFSGGVVYDGLVARIAEKEAVDRLLTLNVAHFQRLTALFNIRVEPP